jgi:hypothetical protein
VPGEVRDAKTKEMKKVQLPTGHGVHSAYEDNMVNRHVPEIMAGVDSILKHPAQPALVAGGHGAATAVVNLMQQTFKAIAPKDIVADYVKVQADKPAAQADALWKSLGQDTIKVMADGAICLAQLWDSAWKEGGGDARISALGEIDPAVLEKLYQNPQFLPSHTLDTIGPLLQNGAAAPADAKAKAAKSKRKARKKKRRT